MLIKGVQKNSPNLNFETNPNIEPHQNVKEGLYVCLKLFLKEEQQMKELEKNLNKKMPLIGLT